MENQGKEIQILLIKSLKGDKEAYRQFFASITPFVESIAHKAFNKQDVPDLMQEIFLSIHQSLPSFDPKRPIRPWLMAIAKRRVIDYIRKLNTQKAKEELTKDGDVTIYPSRSNYKLGDEIPPILNAVSSDTKKAILLTKYQGYSTEEAAKIMGIKSNALRTRVSRGLNLIRQKFEEGHFGE